MLEQCEAGDGRAEASGGTDASVTAGLRLANPSHNWGTSLYSVDKNKDKDKDKPFVYSRPPAFTQILGTGYRVQYHTQNNIIDHCPTKSV